MDGLYKNKFRIRSSRLSTWDYGSTGYYFITICTKGRVPYFGSIVSGRLDETTIGAYTLRCWKSIPQYHPFALIDEFILMPDHLHGIIGFNRLEQTNWQPNKFGPQHDNLAAVVRGFKMAVTSYAKKHTIEFQWQPRYHDHVIRDEGSLKRIRKYIKDNQKNWPM